MSTKIYNGYRIKKVLTFKELNDLANNVVNNYVEIVVQNEVNRISNIYQEILDLNKFKNKEPEKTLFQTAIDYFNDKRKDAYDPSVVFILDEHQTLLLSYLNIDKVQNFLTNLGFEYYGYWDNSDPDENLKEHEWLERKKDWERILLNENKMPYEVGFERKMIDSRTLELKVYEIIRNNGFNSTYSAEQRLSRLFESVLMDPKCQEISSKNPDGQSQIFSDYRKTQRYFNEGEGLCIKNQFLDEAREKLGFSDKIKPLSPKI